MQLFQQSSVVEKGVARRHYGRERFDAYAGAVLSNLIASSIIVATAATLHVSGTTEIETAADAARALAPVVGPAAQTVFAIGLFGASMLAAGVLPLATAYSVSEAFGFRKGVSLDFRRAPIFLGLFSALIALGGVIALIPNVPVIDLLVGVQVLNGILLPAILVFMLLLINDRRLMGDLKNGRMYNLLGWGTFLFVTASVVALFGMQLLELLGVRLFGS
jgi:Mn2+/Fe2+ NRAMP family transporter